VFIIQGNQAGNIKPLWAMTDTIMSGRAGNRFP
jgi:hypothetical protein